MEKNQTNNILLSYEGYGYSKVGYSKYNFILTDDYQAKMDLSIQQEMNYKKVSTEFVSLTNEEIEMVDAFIQEELPTRAGISFDLDGIETYEGFQICYQKDGEFFIINNKYELKGRVDSIKSYIQDNHEEISKKVIASLYDGLCDSMVHKYVSTKQLVKA